MALIILCIALGLLFCFIVASHLLLSKQMKQKFERQNQRLVASKKRELKTMAQLEQLSHQLGEKVIW